MHLSGALFPTDSAVFLFVFIWVIIYRWFEINFFLCLLLFLRLRFCLRKMKGFKSDFSLLVALASGRPDRRQKGFFCFPFAPGALRASFLLRDAMICSMLPGNGLKWPRGPGNRSKWLRDIVFGPALFAQALPIGGP